MNHEIKLLITNQCMKVRSIYEMFDRCHDVKHFDEVFKAAYFIADNLDSKDSGIETAILLAAAYHDTGRLINEYDHHSCSSTILKNDKRLKSFMMTHMKDLYTPTIDLAWRMIFYHRRKYHGDGKAGEIIKRLPEELTELCRIMYDCDKCMDSDKDRVLYRYIAYYLDNIAENPILGSEEEVKKMVDNRWKKLGKGIYEGFNPVSYTFRDFNTNCEYVTGPFEFTKDDIRESYFTNFHNK